MTFHLRCGAVAVLLLFSGSIAFAGSLTFSPSDYLVLSGAQEQLMWHTIHAQSATRIGAQPHFRGLLDGTVPHSIALHALPSSIIRQMPALEAYKYVMSDGRLLIVNPIDRHIVDIITPETIE
jgi:hypothetical protein